MDEKQLLSQFMANSSWLRQGLPLHLVCSLKKNADNKYFVLVCYSVFLLTIFLELTPGIILNIERFSFESRREISFA